MISIRGRSSRWILGLILLAATTGCSIRSLAVRSLADSLAGGGDVWASDEDPELVRDALPFALKTYESLLMEAPDHGELLLATCAGFTQYASAFVEGDALYLEETDWDAAQRLELRAVRLFLRGRDYCLRGLEGLSPGITRRLQLEPDLATAELGSEALPLMFWTGASWGSAISAALDRPELVVDLPAVRALIARALELDEGWENGALHEAMISLESLPEAMGGSPARARQHFERAVELSNGLSAGPYLSLAIGQSVSAGNRSEFEDLLRTALEIDPDERPSTRLATILAQRKASWLLERTDEYFLDELGEGVQR